MPEAPPRSRHPPCLPPTAKTPVAGSTPPSSAGSSHLPPAFSRRAALVFTCLPLRSPLPNRSSPCPHPHPPLLPTHPPLMQQRGWRSAAAGVAQRSSAALFRSGGFWWGGLWRRRWLSSRSPSPAPSSHAHASAVRAGAELSGGEGALPAAAGRGTCASPCPPSPARQQQWCSGRGMLNAPTPKQQRRWPR